MTEMEDVKIQIKKLEEFGLTVRRDGVWFFVEDGSFVLTRCSDAFELGEVAEVIRWAYAKKKRK